MPPLFEKPLLLGIAATAFASCGGSKEAPPQSFPQTVGRVPVVLIVFDALAADHISHLGYERETTPTLDALAAEGVSFNTAFSPAPYTLAGIASLVTGRLPDSHGMVAKTTRLRDEETTLGELITRAGYPSLAVVGNPNGGEAFGDMQGFDRVVNTYETNEKRPPNYTPPSTGEPLHLSMPEEAAAELTPFLDGLEDPAAPFFYYAHILQPHSPYIAPEPTRSRWLDPAYDGPFKGGDNQALIANMANIDGLEQADIDAVRALYDANLLWADQSLALILDELRARGLYDKALIIVTSDHGEAMFQHGRWGHNDTLFEEMVNVPLVVRFPGPADDGLPRGMQLDAPVSIIDILPSLAEWLDLAPPQDLDGHSLAPLIAGAPEAQQVAQARTLRLRDHGLPPAAALRTKDTKAILHRGLVGTDGSPLPDRMEFFELTSDPAEKHDLAPGGDPRSEAAHRAIEAEIARLLAAFKGSATATFSEEEAAMMGALGYVEDDPEPVTPQPIETGPDQ